MNVSHNFPLFLSAICRLKRVKFSESEALVVTVTV